MYRKRWQRMKKKIDSPKTKTQKIIAGAKVTPQAKRAILFHNAFMEGFRKKYHRLKSQRAERRVRNSLHAQKLVHC